jgi:hypothetical protein
MSGIIAQNSGRHTGLVKASSGGGAVWNLIETLTASSSATLDFTSGIDSTYDEYVFKFINIHPETDQTSLLFQGNAAGGSGYDETITSTGWQAQHSESGSTELSYETGSDQAQGTAFQKISHELGNGNDECASGYLHLFGLSDTTFVKHYISKFNAYRYNDYSQTHFSAGYFNTTSAIDEIQFKMSSDAIDAGTISLYGIS